jgi:threonine/homoserine/homoserine lactone efflux protein
VLGPHDFALFVLSGMLLNLTSGPDTLYIVGAAARRRAGARARSPRSASGTCAGLVKNDIRTGLLYQRAQPEGGLFFVAFLPQFVDPAAPNKAAG